MGDDSTNMAAGFSRKPPRKEKRNRMKGVSAAPAAEKEDMAETGRSEKYDDIFTRRYPVTKTYNFGLEPVGRTREYMDMRGVLERDSMRARCYPLVKQAYDDYHRAIITRALEASSEETVALWRALEEAYRGVEESDDAGYSAASAKLSDACGEVAAELEKKMAGYSKEISGKDFWTKELPAFVEGGNCGESEEKLEALAAFASKTTLLDPLAEARGQLYTATSSHTSVPLRCVENYGIYRGNALILERALASYPEVRDELARLSLDGACSLEELLAGPDGFAGFLSQPGIDSYNTLLGGIARESREKEKGINEILNLARQQAGDDAPFYRLKPLRKQILFDAQTASYVAPSFDGDGQMREAIVAFRDELAEMADIVTGEVGSAGSLLTTLFAGIEGRDLERIYVSKSDLWAFSGMVSDSKRAAASAIAECAAEKKGPCAGMTTAQADGFGRAHLSIGQIMSALVAAGARADLARLPECASAAWAAYESMLAPALRALEGNDGPVSADEKKVASIRIALEALVSFARLTRIFARPEGKEVDEDFYASIESMAETLYGASRLFDACRNHLTSRPYSPDKLNVLFDNPGFGGGWDVNKVDANSTILLSRDGAYYLAVLARDITPDGRVKNVMRKAEIEALGGTDEKVEGAYVRHCFKSIREAHMCLPKMFVKSAKHDTPGWVVEGYEAGKHKAGDAFDLDFTRRLIDYYKECIAEHPSFSRMNQDFSPTESYGSMAEFNAEFNDRKYIQWSTYVPAEEIDGAVERGSLYLFRLSNRDLEPGFSGSRSLPSSILIAALSKANELDPMAAIQGGAEVYFRPASLDLSQTIVHKKGSKLVNRTVANDDGTVSTIPEPLYAEIYRRENGMSDAPLSEEAEAWAKRAVVKEASEDRVKYNRFLTDHFELHVPVTLNFRVATGGRFAGYLASQDALAYAGAEGLPNIVAVKRAERNLLFVSVVAPDGTVLEQRSLDRLNGTDWNEKLTVRERERMDARRQWTKIDSIANIKDNFIGNAVAEIAKLAVKYRAFVAVENFEEGFRETSSRIEKAVYQDFCRRLVEKLSYCVVDRDPEHAAMPGGLLNGYQLCGPWEGYSKTYLQSGAVFFESPSYLTAIDCRTGFVNRMAGIIAKCKSQQAIRGMIGSFGRIAYKGGRFELEFAYENFAELAGKKASSILEGDSRIWTASTSHAKRMRTEKAEGKARRTEVDLTKELKVICVRADIEFSDGQDLRASLCSLKGEDLKEAAALIGLVFQGVNYGNDSITLLSPIEDESGAQVLAEGPCATSAYGSRVLALKTLGRLKGSEYDAGAKNGNGQYRLGRIGVDDLAASLAQL